MSREHDRQVTIIGAGSAVFTRTIIGDMLTHQALQDTRFVLEDIDPERLRVAGMMASQMIDQRGLPARVTTTLNQRDAIKGSDYVITMFQSGGLKATQADFNAAKKYNHPVTIGDSYGPLALSRALRTIPIIDEVVHDIQDVAQDAYLLNYTNPQGVLVWSAHEQGLEKVAGLCHSVSGTAEQIARYTQTQLTDLEYDCAGINHIALYYPLRRKGTGEEIYPLLLQAANEPTIYGMDPVRFDLLRQANSTGHPRFVTESSEHAAEYYPRFLHDNPHYRERWQDEYVKRSLAQDASWRATSVALANGTFTDTPRRSQEYAPAIIAGIETGMQQTVFINTPNTTPQGHLLISDLPPDSIVEVRTVVNKSGLHPQQYGELHAPEPYNSVMRDHIDTQRKTVRAIREGTRQDIYDALLTDPRVRAEMKPDTAIQMIDELIEAHTAESYGSVIPKRIRNKHVQVPVTTVFEAARA